MQVRFFEIDQSISIHRNQVVGGSVPGLLGSIVVEITTILPE